MNPRILVALTAAISFFVVAACGQSNPPPASAQSKPGAQLPAASAQVPAPPPGPVSAPLPKSGTLAIEGFVSQIPAAWTPTQPNSSMRFAQFDLPAAAGAGAGEVAAYFFPSGQGGSQEANIARWVSQFAGADGKPVAPKTSTVKRGDIAVTLVELHGTYARGVGMGPTGEAKPDQILMVAMVETAKGRINLQMHGPSKTVAAQRDDFLKLANGFHSAQ
jgi:hypothetical protein